MILGVVTLVVLFPILLMAFALSMERLEARVRRTGVGEDEVVEFLDQASASDVQNLARDGLPRALDVFRLRRHRRRSSQRRPTTTERPAR